VAYLITTTTNNGYRCSCCKNTWDSTHWVEGREEALAEVSTTLPDIGECELEGVTVTDGTTGQVIAEGFLDYGGGTKADLYRYSRWHGHIDGVRFEHITGVESGESWDDLMRRLRRTAAENKVKAAEAELERLKKKLEST
jgi:hypothetical protein